MNRCRAIAATIGLAACGAAECPDDDPSCDGSLLAGQVAFAANRAALDGAFAPTLAGCTVTRTEPTTSQIWQRTYDARGRLVVEASGFGETTSPIHERTWEGGCAVHEVDHIRVAEVERTCDDQGWPVEEIRTEPGTTERPDVSRTRWVHTYEGRRLVHSVELAVEGGLEEVVSYREITWRDGHPVEQLWTDPTASDQAVPTTWTWEGDRLVARTGDPRDGSAPGSWTWTHTVEGLLLEARLDGEPVQSWLREPGDYWPYLEVDGDGTGYGLDIPCDPPTN